MSKQLTLNDIFKMFLAHIKLIVIMAIVGAIVAFAYVSVFVDEVYSTKALLLVQNDSGLTDADTTLNSDEKVNTKDISDSVMLANTCTILFTTDPDMTELFSGCTVTISPIEESYFLEVEVSSTEPDRAANVANQVVQRAPVVFEKYFKSAGRVDTVYEAQIPSFPSSPNVKQFVIMGLLIGLLLALGISFLVEIVDTTIKPDDDLYAMYDIPVFAEIVDFEVEGGARKK